MKKIIKAFFYNSDGKFKVVFFWSTLFLLIFATAAIVSLIHPERNYTGLLGTLAGLSTGLIAVYNQGKNRTGRKK